MIQSMTGYGRAETIYNSSRIIAEIRSVNGKGAEISLKTSLIPREKELEIKKNLSLKLIRGNIDLFIAIESIPNSLERSFNGELFVSYCKKLKEIYCLLGEEFDISHVAGSILRMPDVIETQKKEQHDERQWKAVEKAVNEAVSALTAFRIAEGKKMDEDITLRINTILSFLDETEKYEQARIGAVRERLISRLAEISSFPADSNRLEQELIYYMEKIDITEEKVRLRQHCSYFLDTVKEDAPGRKLGFIAQEMGREINTMGSKANHVEIQKWVVRMKDELEKIKEQAMNIL